ncbi:globin domain-containing protein [Micromonospora sp. LOL_024]|uniref:globin domain-containing protein n=1 Tax=Micromonospora sp. LOL_024 TaxID=3345412 RepID=UPI003A87FBE2
MDVSRLKQSWSLVVANGDQVPLYFYSTLFLAYPETRPMFPTNMAGQRDRLVNALGHIVSQVDQVDRLVGFLQDLGADHRRFAVRVEHYPAVGEALLATVRHFLEAPWWVAEIVGHERRAFDVAVLTLRPQYLLPFHPGQSVGVSHPAVRSCTGCAVEGAGGAGGR